MAEAIRGALAAVMLLGALAAPAGAQSQGWTGSGETLEDLRYRLGILDAELADIRARIGAMSGGQAPAPAASGEAMVRLDRLEVEIRRLTGEIEELAFRQRRMAEDAARRFGDIAYRLTELEGGDPAALAPQEPLGGVGAGEERAAAPSGPAPSAPEPRAPEPEPEPEPGQAEPAAPAAPPDERADLELAVADIRQGRFDQGEQRLRRFLDEYPDSPRAAAANFWLGRSHFVRGSFADAARRHLAGYNVDRSGPMAPRNLLQLGITLGRLGQVSEACLTLREVSNQFPGADREILNAADAERDSLACPP
jgi:tol-pal system protein YbgF